MLWPPSLAAVLVIGAVGVGRRGRRGGIVTLSSGFSRGISYNYSQKIWRMPWFLCEMLQCWKGSISVFQGFLLVLAIFSFQGEDWAQAVVLWGHDFFLVYPSFLNCTSFGNSWSNSLVYVSLLPVIMLLFTCGERKICSSIKKSQNIINMIVNLTMSSIKTNSIEKIVIIKYIVINFRISTYQHGHCVKFDFSRVIWKEGA